MREDNPFDNDEEEATPDEMQSVAITGLFWLLLAVVAIVTLIILVV